MKLTGLSEQYDSGRNVIVQQEGPHVLLSVDAGQDSRQGTALITPGQAYALAAALTNVAAAADKVELEGLP